MRPLRNGLAAALLLGACAPVAFLAPAFAQTCTCPPGGGGYVIQADEAPPPLPEYDQPPIPAPGYYWTPGYWAWNNYDYYWVPGSWVEPPQPGLLWTPGYWAFVGGAYAFRPGYWGPRVGFYGGIDYGYGYGGDGYQGGRWDNNRFFYNTSVNNIGGARIANVYHQPILANPAANRASFNGGPGGMAAKPTSEQLLAEKETHVRATKLQVNQARDAGMRSEQFVSTNRGKPAVAATERPGQFKGKGVVPARAAGKGAEATPADMREKPAALEKPLTPGAAPGAAKVEEKRAPAETLVKPETAPNPPKAEEKRPPAEKLAKPEAAPGAPKAEEKRAPAEKLAKPEAAPAPPKAEERRPPAEKLAKPETAPNPPKIEERRPAIEKAARPEAPSGAQRALERPPAQLGRPPAQLERPPAQLGRPPAQAERRPAQPERRPEACGRPGLPPCPK
ncbi:MAG TPA: hypothetical protein VGG79_25720 [Roseiarcus sp.]